MHNFMHWHLCVCVCACVRVSEVAYLRVHVSAKGCVYVQVYLHVVGGLCVYACVCVNVCMCVFSVCSLSFIHVFHSCSVQCYISVSGNKRTQS